MMSSQITPEEVPAQAHAVSGSNEVIEPRCHEDARRIIDAATAILAQGEILLLTVSAETYQQRVPQAFDASMGGHYRHCLDHFTSLLRDLEGQKVDYDHRERDVRIELHPEFALAATQRLRAQLEQLPLECLEAPVQTRCEVSYAAGNAPVTHSTLGRELVYAITHAIHHYALMAVLSQLTNGPLPEHFGLAPSTRRHRNSTTPGTAA